MTYVVARESPPGAEVGAGVGVSVAPINSRIGKTIIDGKLLSGPHSVYQSADLITEVCAQSLGGTNSALKRLYRTRTSRIPSNDS